MNPHPARLRRLVALAALSLTMLPATAVAQTPSDDGYDTDEPTVQNKIDGGGSAGRNETGSNTTPSTGDRAGLPFTGMDLGLLAGAGVLLVGLGAGMRVVLRLPPHVR